MCVMCMCNHFFVIKIVMYVCVPSFSFLPTHTPLTLIPHPHPTPSPSSHILIPHPHPTSSSHILTLHPHPHPHPTSSPSSHTLTLHPHPHPTPSPYTLTLIPHPIPTPSPTPSPHTLTPTFPGNLNDLKKTPVVIKEGCKYRLKIQFRVQREIVSGLRYQQVTYRKGIRGE